MAARGGAFRVESRRHPAVDAVVALRETAARRASGLCLAEGPHLVGEALSAGWQPVAVFATDGWNEAALVAALRPRLLAPHRPGADRGWEGDEALPAAARGWWRVSSRVMAAIAGTRTPQGLVTVFAPPDGATSAAADWTLVLDGVQDPGNVGALARCLFAFGGAGSLLITGPGAADPLAEKALRASAGASFHLRHRHVAADLAAAVGALPTRRFALCAHGGESLVDAGLSAPLALVVGAEGAGVGPAVRALCRPVTVPLRPGAESLNVAAAAAVALYEATRAAPP